MWLRPVPIRFEMPPVDNVADEIDRVGVVPTQKIEQPIGLTSARAEMHVGDEKRPKLPQSGFHRCACPR